MNCLPTNTTMNSNTDYVLQTQPGPTTGGMESIYMLTHPGLSYLKWLLRLYWTKLSCYLCTLTGAQLERHKHGDVYLTKCQPSKWPYLLFPSTFQTTNLNPYQPQPGEL